jgi:hypothetical protein
LRRNSHYTPTLDLPSPAPSQNSHEACQFQQIGNAEEGPSFADLDLQIPGFQIGPLARNRSDTPTLDLKQEPGAGPSMTLAQADQLLPAEWMKRMRHANKVRSCGGDPRILS